MEIGGIVNWQTLESFNQTSIDVSRYSTDSQCHAANFAPFRFMIISRDFFSTHRLLPCALTQLADYDAVRRSWVQIQEFSLTLCGPNAMTKANVQVDVRIHCHCTLPAICLLLIHESHLFKLRVKTCVILAVFFQRATYVVTRKVWKFCQAFLVTT